MKAEISKPLTELDARHETPRALWRTLAACSTPEARALIPREYAERLPVLPLSTKQDDFGRILLVVVAVPLSFERKRELSFISGAEIVEETAERSEVERAVHAVYRGSGEGIAQLLGDFVAAFGALPEDSPQAPVAEKPIPRLLEAILDLAFSVEASDIHFEPTRSGVRVRFRIDGSLEELSIHRIVGEAYKELVRYVKISCGLDSAGPERPEEGSFTKRRGREQIRIRVSCLPVVGGQKLVLRLLYNPFLENLLETPDSLLAPFNLSETQSKLLRRNVDANSGALLVSGPTGSGKSTFLYALLALLLGKNPNIITLEDPVERIIDGVSQTEICPERGMDFSDLLPKLLRQDPDVILVGELRDSVSAATALEAALTGVLVLSSIHAASALEVCIRLLQLGLKPEMFRGSLNLVSSQRLLPQNCSSCKSFAAPDAFVSRTLHLPPGLEIARSLGCAQCRFSGISGRVSVFEFLECTDSFLDYAFREKQTPSLQTLRRLAVRDGYVPLPYAIRDQVIAGRVSARHALMSLGISSYTPV